MVLLQIQNLERKVNGKFDKQDEINVNNGDRLDQLKDQVERNTKNIKDNGSNIEIIFERLNDLKASMDDNIDLMNKDLNDKLTKLKNYIDEKINEYN